MARHHYRPGDTIALKPQALDRARPQGAGRIVSALPEAQGLVRYRVRFEGETFDRNVGEDDIDRDGSTVGSVAPAAVATKAGSGASWINHHSIRIRK